LECRIRNDDCVEYPRHRQGPHVTADPRNARFVLHMSNTREVPIEGDDKPVPLAARGIATLPVPAPTTRTRLEPREWSSQISHPAAGRRDGVGYASRTGEPQLSPAIGADGLGCRSRGALHPHRWPRQASSATSMSFLANRLPADDEAAAEVGPPPAPETACSKLLHATLGGCFAHTYGRQLERSLVSNLPNRTPLRPRLPVGSSATYSRIPVAPTPTLNAPGSRFAIGSRSLTIEQASSLSSTREARD
jgi:hypothetical protein